MALSRPRAAICIAVELLVGVKKVWPEIRLRVGTHGFSTVNECKEFELNRTQPAGKPVALTAALSYIAGAPPPGSEHDSSIKTGRLLPGTHQRRGDIGNTGSSLTTKARYMRIVGATIDKVSPSSPQGWAP